MNLLLYEIYRYQNAWYNDKNINTGFRLLRLLTIVVVTDRRLRRGFRKVMYERVKHKHHQELLK